MDNPPELTEKEFWEAEAANWIAWAREPGHDGYWDYSPMFFRDMVPPPRGRTLEIGCGEGRVTRDLQHHGHDVYSIDAAPTLVLAAQAMDPKGRYVHADAALLPFGDAVFELVVAYNSLMDMDDMPTTVVEAARVLRPGGRMAICVTHPVIDAGGFEQREADARFVIEGDYLSAGFYDQTFERAGMVMRFVSLKQTIESYSRALEAAGLLIERLREPAVGDDIVKRDPAKRRWQRLPGFMFIGALKLIGDKGDRRTGDRYPETSRD
jgi:ubiquinone/menaquinone biosynthesis C-methylase UbiE